MAPLDTLGERLRSLRLCTPEAVGAMQASLCRHGQLQPIAVAASSEAGSLEVVDGFRRLCAARQLGWTDLRIRELAVDAVGAKLALLLLNQGRGLGELEEGWLVQSLYRADGLSQPAIAHLFGRDKSWVCRRLALAEGLCDDVATDVRLGLLSGRAGAELARLSRDNQPAAAEVVVHGGFTCAQTGRLVAAVLACPDAAAREALLEEQREHPAPLPAPRPRPRRRRNPLEEMLADTGLCVRTATRLQVRLCEHPLSVLGERAAALLCEAIFGALPVLRALERTCARITEGALAPPSPGESTCADAGARANS
jgi:ParB-like chromosome segregation protein Spo0J